MQKKIIRDAGNDRRQYRNRVSGIIARRFCFSRGSCPQAYSPYTNTAVDYSVQQITIRMLS